MLVRNFVCFDCCLFRLNDCFDYFFEIRYVIFRCICNYFFFERTSTALARKNNNLGETWIILIDCCDDIMAIFTITWQQNAWIMMNRIEDRSKNRREQFWTNWNHENPDGKAGVSSHKEPQKQSPSRDVSRLVTSEYFVIWKPNLKIWVLYQDLRKRKNLHKTDWN